MRSLTARCVVIFAALVGLAGEAVQAQASVDSSGVQVRTVSALDSSAAPISVGAEPIFRVGLDPTGRLFERITGIAVLDDGRIAVGDGGATQEVVLLRPDGSVDRVLGGSGEGPGEFSRLSNVQVKSSGAVVAQDYWAARITVFEADGDVVTMRVPLRDHGTVLGASGDSLFMGPPLQLVQGRRYTSPWRRVPLTILQTASSRVDTVGIVDWEQSLDFNGRDPWAAEGFTAFHDGAFIYARGDVPEVHWYDSEGVPTRIVRFQSLPEGVTAEDRSAFETWYRSELSEGLGLPGGQMRDFLAGVTEQIKGVKPYFGDLKVDPDGRVWLGEWHNASFGAHQSGRRYFLMSPDGRPIGSVELPTGFRLLAVDRDRVLGYELGPFGEHLVVAYPLGASVRR